MKKYLITVNGVSYEVEVEEMDGPVNTAPTTTTATQDSPAPAPQKATAPAPAPQKPAAPIAKPAAAGAGEQITAPMPGTILNVLVSVGQSVKKGDVLCILEAMKMENEIVAHRDGVVASIGTNKGASVNAGDPLVGLE